MNKGFSKVTTRSNMGILQVTTCFVCTNHSTYCFFVPGHFTSEYDWHNQFCFFVPVSFLYNHPNPNHPRILVHDSVKLFDVTSTFLQPCCFIPWLRRGQRPRSGRLHPLRAAHRLQWHTQWFDATGAGAMWLWTRPRGVLGNGGRPWGVLIGRWCFGGFYVDFRWFDVDFMNISGVTVWGKKMNFDLIGSIFSRFLDVSGLYILSLGEVNHHLINPPQKMW